jgi:hypothetical protein
MLKEIFSVRTHRIHLGLSSAAAGSSYAANDIGHGLPADFGQKEAVPHPDERRLQGQLLVEPGLAVEVLPEIHAERIVSHAVSITDFFLT